MSSNSPTLKCIGCESETGWVVTKVELVKFYLEGGRRILSNLGNAFNLDAYHHAVVILFGCKHCERGMPVHVTYEFEQSGVLVTEGYPSGDKAPTHYQFNNSWNFQPLLYSQVDAIKNGMNWPGSQYFPVFRDCQCWAQKFMEKLKSATARNVPLRPFNIVKADIVEQETGEVLRHNLEMKFSKRQRRNIEQMADEAFVQSGLNAELYKWRQVAQRNQLPDGNIGFVEVDNGTPIEDGAFYQVKVVKKLIVNAGIVEHGTGEVLQDYMEMGFWDRVNVLQMVAKAFEQSGLNPEDYELPEVKQCNQLANVGTEFVDLENDAPIVDGALYQVVVCKPIVVKMDVVEQGTGGVLLRNVEMKFSKRELATISQMATKALEQYDLKLEGYRRDAITKRTELANGTEYVDVNSADPIEHGAFYKVEVHKQKLNNIYARFEPNNIEIDIYLKGSQELAEMLAKSIVLTKGGIWRKVKQCKYLDGKVYVDVDMGAPPVDANSAICRLVPIREQQ